MYVMKETIDIHGCPSETADTRSQSSLEVIDVGSEETTSVGSDFAHDTNALSYNVLKLVVVVLELLFLEEHNFGTFWDFDSNTRQTFCFTNESEDFTVKVHVELEVLEMADKEGSLESCLCTVNLLLPFLTPHILIGEQGVTKRVMVLDCLSNSIISLSHEVLRELFHGHRNAVE